jgi:pentatricopeptide repeat protein
MEGSEMKPYTVTYNTCLQCALKARDFEVAEAVFDRIPDKDVISYSTYIKGLFKIGKY